jgi:hypothetical protein
LGSQQIQPFLWNGSANMPIVRHWLSSHHMIAATDMLATIEQLLEVVFSVQSAAIAASFWNI